MSGQKPVSLIWGLPGTGKTKTTTLLLCCMHKAGHRTVTCAPTNTTVKQVASRLLKSVKQNSSDGNTALGDFFIFGNRNRLHLDQDLEEIFFDYHIKQLLQCFSPQSGWKHHLSSMAELLQECPSLYSTHLRTAPEGGKMTFTAFFRKRFDTLFKELGTCFRMLLLHVPRSCLPEADSSSIMKNFCLKNACLIFCTVCTSYKMYQVKRGRPVELLVIDEVAQLKESELLIPLQLPGLKHAVLIGDECQLSSLVKSKNV